MKHRVLLMVSIVIIFFAVDFLAFHDIAEVHTVRDWLTLVGSLLVFIYFAKELSGKKK